MCVINDTAIAIQFEQVNEFFEEFHPLSHIILNAQTMLNSLVLYFIYRTIA